MGTQSFVACCSRLPLGCSSAAGNTVWSRPQRTGYGFHHLWSHDELAKGIVLHQMFLPIEPQQRRRKLPRVSVIDAGHTHEVAIRVGVPLRRKVGDLVFVCPLKYLTRNGLGSSCPALRARERKKTNFPSQHAWATCLKGSKACFVNPSLVTTPCRQNSYRRLLFCLPFCKGLPCCSRGGRVQEKHGSSTWPC